MELITPLEEARGRPGDRTAPIYLFRPIEDQPIIIGQQALAEGQFEDIHGPPLRRLPRSIAPIPGIETFAPAGYGQFMGQYD